MLEDELQETNRLLRQILAALQQQNAWLQEFVAARVVETRETQPRPADWPDAITD